MDLPEAARFLEVSGATLQRWVRQGLLRPSGAGAEAFDRAVLERWARAHRVRVGRARERGSAPAERMLASAIRRGAVLRRGRVADAFEAIRVAVAALPGLAPGTQAELLAQVLDRERMASTGLGQGVALPHPRTPPGDVFEDPHVVVVHLSEPVDWAALDGEPVHTVMLLMSPTAPAHLQLLSRVAQTLRAPGFLDFLRGQPDQAALVERVHAIEQELGE